MSTQIIGVDPGPTAGVVALWPKEEPHGIVPIIRVFQCNWRSTISLLYWLAGLIPDPTLIAQERYQVLRGTGRLSDPKASQLTRDLNGSIAMMHDVDRGLRVIETRAVDVKRWSSEDRLRAAGLWDPTIGMRHARSACWHLMHTAVFQAGWPDPISNTTDKDLWPRRAVVPERKKA